ncbi:MAG: deoxyribose-phosphate aldolase [Coriobacteriia bacterium]|nr:deoxyribose-phosphate aldolase [Coriobacteriia bacterium]
MSVPGYSELAAFIDQTLLSPTIGLSAGARWIAENRDRGFASLCVAPFLVPLASAALRDCETKTCSVVGFPLGYSLAASKAEEAKLLCEQGCDEIDMVLNIAALLEGDSSFVRDDIAGVVEAVRSAGRPGGLVKVILETGYLGESDIRLGCRLAVEAGADFVKTSTGFGPRGASARDVEIMVQEVESRARVKAAGGIRSLDLALELIAAGAVRIGTSAGQEILSEAWKQEALDA